ncbi:MAG: GH3 auxin-responsive promoter family protein [Saprospiraceae bacterium]|nr:GH3 auxin-responsive promoter family protein [Saprospiraceae bacterium]
MIFFPYRYLLDRMRSKPEELQRALLKRIVEGNRRTLFGREHGFSEINGDYDRYVLHLPIQAYDDLIPWLQKMPGLKTSQDLLSVYKPKYFGQTSGTSAVKKRIPISEEFLRANHFRGSRLILANLDDRFQQDWLMGAKHLSMSGYRYPDPFLGKDVLDISGLMVERLPWYFRFKNFPNQVFGSWEEKLSFFQDHLQDIRRINMISGVPTWVLALINQLTEHDPSRIVEIMPDWRLYVHGGVDFSHYRQIFKEIHPKREITLFEVYNATEGFYALQNDPSSPDLLLLTDVGIFYEFQDKLTEEVLPLWAIQTDRKYELLITTLDGLCRYRTGDLVQFSSTKPYLLQIMGRTTEFINAFGEDLSMEHVSLALQRLKGEMAFHIRQYFVVPRYPQPGKSGSHEWYINFEIPPDDLQRFALRLDVILQDINGNYQQKRSGNTALLPLVVHELALDSMHSILRRKGEIGGQIKMKVLHNDRKILDYMEA